MKVKGILVEAIAKWGNQSQIDMAVEEMGELLTAIGHEKRGRISKVEVVGEIVDVFLCLEQLKLIYDDGDDFDAIMLAKLNRLKELLNRPQHREASNSCEAMGMDW